MSFICCLRSCVGSHAAKGKQSAVSNGYWACFVTAEAPSGSRDVHLPPPSDLRIPLSSLWEPNPCKPMPTHANRSSRLAFWTSFNLRCLANGSLVFRLPKTDHFLRPMTHFLGCPKLKTWRKTCVSSIILDVFQNVPGVFGQRAGRSEAYPGKVTERPEPT